MKDNGFSNCKWLIFLIIESLPDCPEFSFDGTRYHTNLRWHEKLKWKAKWAGWLAEFDLSLAQLSPSLFLHIRSLEGTGRNAPRYNPGNQFWDLGKASHFFGFLLLNTSHNYLRKMVKIGDYATTPFILRKRKEVSSFWWIFSSPNYKLPLFVNKDNFHVRPNIGTKQKCSAILHNIYVLQFVSFMRIRRVVRFWK